MVHGHVYGAHLVKDPVSCLPYISLLVFQTLLSVSEGTEKREAMAGCCLRWALQKSCSTTVGVQVTGRSEALARLPCDDGLWALFLYL